MPVSAPVDQNDTQKNTGDDADGRETESEIRTLFETETGKRICQTGGGPVATFKSDLDQCGRHRARTEYGHQNKKCSEPSDNVLSPGDGLTEGHLRAGDMPDFLDSRYPLADKYAGEDDRDQKSWQCAEDGQDVFSEYAVFT